MKEKPILFNGEMVNAILAGRKTMTRRILHLPDSAKVNRRKGTYNCYEYGFVGKDIALPKCPYGQAGTILWVREAWAKICNDEHFLYSDNYKCPEGCKCEIQYKADHPGCRYPADWPNDCGGGPDVPKWRPSIYMPRWASRITLEVVDVRVERVQDITDEDCLNEGICQLCKSCEFSPDSGCAYTNFCDLWDSINAKRGFGWHVNPWVWVIEFRRVDER